jgi:hypothetical protein
MRGKLKPVKRRLGIVAALFALAVLVQTAVVFAGGSSTAHRPSAVPLPWR